MAANSDMNEAGAIEMPPVLGAASATTSTTGLGNRRAAGVAAEATRTGACVDGCRVDRLRGTARPTRRRFGDRRSATAASADAVAAPKPFLAPPKPPKPLFAGPAEPAPLPEAVPVVLIFSVLLTLTVDCSAVWRGFMWR